MKPVTRTLRDAITLCLALACIGCASTASGQQPQATASVAVGSGVTSEYRIGPGDTLSVVVARQPELSAELPVRPDGTISTPYVDDMVAVGKTPTQLANDIEAVLAEYLNAPVVTVLVLDFVGVVGSQIRVLGEVVNPGPVPYRDGITLIDVMFAVGGMTEFGAGRRARLIRTIDGVTEEIDVRLDRLLERGDTSENFVMQPGDVVVVPQTRF
jgi:polysaccharide export outer membrane protein